MEKNASPKEEEQGNDGRNFEEEDEEDDDDENFDASKYDLSASDASYLLNHNLLPNSCIMNLC